MSHSRNCGVIVVLWQFVVPRVLFFFLFGHNQWTWTHLPRDTHVLQEKVHDKYLKEIEAGIYLIIESKNLALAEIVKNMKFSTCSLEISSWIQVNLMTQIIWKYVSFN